MADISKINNGTTTYNLKDSTAARDTDVVKLAGSTTQTISRKTQFGTGLVVSDTISREVNNSHLVISGGESYEHGASIWLKGKSISSDAGKFVLRANDGTDACDLTGTPGGSLIWGGDSVEGEAFSKRAMPDFDNSIYSWSQTSLASGASLTYTNNTGYNGYITVKARNDSTEDGCVDIRHGTSQETTSEDSNIIRLAGGLSTQNSLMYVTLPIANGDCITVVGFMNYSVWATIFKCK